MKLVYSTISTTTSYHNQSMVFSPVFSKYVPTRIRNMSPIRKKQEMIRIFAEAFDYGNVFSKSKTNIDKD